MLQLLLKQLTFGEVPWGLMVLCLRSEYAEFVQIQIARPAWAPD